MGFPEKFSGVVKGAFEALAPSSLQLATARELPDVVNIIKHLRSAERFGKQRQPWKQSIEKLLPYYLKNPRYCAEVISTLSPQIQAYICEMLYLSINELTVSQNNSAESYIVFLQYLMSLNTTQSSELSDLLGRTETLPHNIRIEISHQYRLSLVERVINRVDRKVRPIQALITFGPMSKIVDEYYKHKYKQSESSSPESNVLETQYVQEAKDLASFFQKPNNYVVAIAIDISDAEKIIAKLAHGVVSNTVVLSIIDSSQEKLVALEDKIKHFKLNYKIISHSDETSILIEKKTNFDEKPKKKTKIKKRRRIQ